MKDYRDDQPKGARYVFGIFMVIFYILIGLLLILLQPVWGITVLFDEAIAATVGGILILYGIYRGYRMYKNGY